MAKIPVFSETPEELTGEMTAIVREQWDRCPLASEVARKFLDGHGGVGLLSKSISYHPEYESTRTRYCLLCHSKLSVATVYQGMSGVGCEKSGCLGWCGAKLLQTAQAST